MNHTLPENAKVQYFQSLLREKATEFYQSLTITSEGNLIDMLTKFRKRITQEDLKELGQYIWDQAKNDPTAETFTDFLKCQKVISEQAFQENVGQYN